MNEEQAILKKSWEIFKDHITEEKFNTTLSKFEEKEKWNFIRGCLSYLSAIRFTDLDNNIRNLLLCISIESISNNEAKTISFKDWLIKSKLTDLSNKTPIELKDKLNNLFQEYLQVEEREGCFYNFKKFLNKYCSERLKKQEIFSKPDFKNFDKDKEFFDFDFAIGYMYSQFRSLFAHRGIGRIETSKSLGLMEEDTIMIADSMLDKYNGEYVHVNMLDVLNWFDKVVFASLLNYLMEKNEKSK